jgi:glycosyltransferase involved in cell wall biosynthesis
MGDGFRELLLVDYIGNAGADGKPAGHPLPALKQYVRLLQGEFRVKVCAPRNYSGKVQLDFPLPFFQMAGKSRGFSTFLDSARKLANLFLLPPERPGEVRLFVNMDINLALYCLFRRKRSRRWMVLYTLFDEGNSLARVAKAFLLRRLFAGMDRILCSGEALLASLPPEKTTWIPDFVYFGSASPTPQPQAGKGLLCVGTMNRDKDILGLVRMAKAAGMELRVAGKFMDEGGFRAIREECEGCDKIVVENRYLGEEEYDSEIRRCAFVCLPYDPQSYRNRTSGVLLEVLFRGKPVIAPDFGFFRLVEGNGLGINYQNLEQVPEKISGWSEAGFGASLARFLEPYRADNVRKRLLAEP